MIDLRFAPNIPKNFDMELVLRSSNVIVSPQYLRLHLKVNGCPGACIHIILYLTRTWAYIFITLHEKTMFYSCYHYRRYPKYSSGTLGF
jgi:hypothetical protein